MGEAYANDAGFTMESAADPVGEVVAFPLPLYGHINSMLNLCKFLASNGFSITFVNAQSYHDRFISQSIPGIKFVAIPDNLDTPIAALNIHSGNNMGIFRRACTAMKGDLEKAVASIQGPVRCILADFSSVEWVRQSADKLNVPCVVFFLMSAACLSIHWCIPQLTAAGHIPVSPGGGMGDTISYLPGFPTLNTIDIPFMLGTNAEKIDPGFKCRLDRIEGIKGAKSVMVNSFESLEPAIFSSLQASSDLDTVIVPIGPIMPPVDQDHKQEELTNKQDEECIKWLNKQDKGSVIYVAFGSCASLSLERFREIAIGLGESKCPFLWVLRQSLVPTSTIDELLEIIHDNTTVDFHTVSWAPQMEVLANPSVGCFFTHCGWNSTLESIWYGVPMICLPLSAEQNLNSKFVSDEWKIGVRLVLQINHQDVNKAIAKVMSSQDGVQMKLAAEHLKEASHKEALKNIISNI